MPLKDWSTTAASNNAASPYGAAEGWALSDINNVMRQVMADVRTLAASDTIASASTTDLGTKDSTFLTVSGTTTITGLGTVSAGIYKFVTFSGALILTHNGTSLILPGSANITTVAGDTALFLSLGSGNWKCMFYERISGSPLNANLSAIAALAVTDNNIIVGNGSTWVAESGATARASLGLTTGTSSGNVPLVGTKSASTTLAGLVEQSTSGENVAGTDDTVFPSVAGVKEMISTHVLTTKTAVASTSGTEIDFTGIPSTAKRITVMLSGVSTNGTSPYQIQLGDAGGFEITSYSSSSMRTNIVNVANTTSSTGLLIDFNDNSSNTRSGIVFITKVTGNTWVSSSTLSTGNGENHFGAGTKTLSDTLTQIRITTVVGTDTFDAGTINIMYE